MPIGTVLKPIVGLSKELHLNQNSNNRSTAQYSKTSRSIYSNKLNIEVLSKYKL